MSNFQVDGDLTFDVTSLAEELSSDHGLMTEDDVDRWFERNFDFDESLSQAFRHGFSIEAEYVEDLKHVVQDAVEEALEDAPGGSDVSDELKALHRRIKALEEFQAKVISAFQILAGAKDNAAKRLVD